MNRRSGFTLIELLVVIAIIGILAAIVLNSLATAKSKGKDAGVEENLHGMTTQMEVYLQGNGNSYSGGCASANAQLILSGAMKSAGASAVQTSGAGSLAPPGKVTCHDNATQWEVEAPIVNSTAMWCLDSVGDAKQESAAMGGSDYACL